MIPNNGRKPLTRREILKASGGGGLALITATAGCLESGDDGGSGGDGGNGGGDGGSDSGGGSGGSDTLTIGMVDSVTGSLAPYGERNERGRT
ncbi:ABC transporter substrate-binding protein, partial [Enterococcus hirae]